MVPGVCRIELELASSLVSGVCRVELELDGFRYVKSRARIRWFQVCVD